ncbi:MAG: FAD-dependent oxidoreductase [Patescibacteria group bacterium]
MKLILIDKKKITINTKSFIFKPEKKIKWIAGQYFIYFLKHDKEDLRGIMRFFTISSSPFEKYITISTKVSDKSSSFKKSLDNLKIGDEIIVKGPDGDFIIEDVKKNLVFIAGGIGITPFISIIRQLNFEKKLINISLLYSNKTKAFAFKNELDKISKNNKKLQIKYFISPKKIDKSVLKKHINNKSLFYISGPDPMVESITKILVDLGIKDEDIRKDYFSGYKS